MIAIARTCFLLLCDNTILPFRPKSKSESQNFEVSWRKKILTKLESELKNFQVSWISKCQVTPMSSAASRRGGGGKGREGEGREEKGRRGEVDSDAQLEQGRVLAKAGPV